MMKFRTVVEEQFLLDFLEGCIQKHVPAVQDDHRVDDVFEIPDLVRGDHDGGIVGGVFKDRVPELGLRRDVESVGRLIQEEVLAVASKRE